MENQNYQEIINNLGNPEKVKKATSKKVNILETLKKLKEHYHKISHDDYYTAKASLDKNVELKKSLREEIRKLEPLKEKATITDKEESQIIRINKLLEEQRKVPEKGKEVRGKIVEIEEKIHELKIIMKESFE